MRKNARKPCSVDGCERLADAKGLCHAHYKRARRGNLKPETPFKRRRSPGQPSAFRYVGPDGYAVKRWPEHPNARKDGLVFEHVMVMTAYLGRRLEKGETVHHRNGVRDDNRIENLELRVQAHPRGLSIGEVVAWAKEILHRYEEVDVVEH